jgi:hypothetical protein
VCATHQRPLNCRIDSAWGQTSGGFSPIFSKSNLPSSSNIGVIGLRGLCPRIPRIHKPAPIFGRFIGRWHSVLTSVAEVKANGGGQAQRCAAGIRWQIPSPPVHLTGGNGLCSVQWHRHPADGPDSRAEPALRAKRKGCPCHVARPKSGLFRTIRSGQLGLFGAVAAPVGWGLPHRFLWAGENWVCFARSVPPIAAPRLKLGLFCIIVPSWVGRPRPTCSELALFC